MEKTENGTIAERLYELVMSKLHPLDSQGNPTNTLEKQLAAWDDKEKKSLAMAAYAREQKKILKSRNSKIRSECTTQENAIAQFKAQMPSIAQTFSDRELLERSATHITRMHLPECPEMASSTEDAFGDFSGYGTINAWLLAYIGANPLIKFDEMRKILKAEAKKRGREIKNPYLNIHQLATSKRIRYVGNGRRTEMQLILA